MEITCTNPKLEIRNPPACLYEVRKGRQAGNKFKSPNDQMTKTSGDRQYDLEDRTYEFACRVRAFVKKLPRTICNTEDVKQVVPSSGSVGANYIEANEALSKKDFRLRIRICRKESKETRYWLRLLDTHENATLNAERDKLVQESTELMRIFGAILP